MAALEGEKWWDPEFMLRVETVDLLADWPWGQEEGRGQDAFKRRSYNYLRRLWEELIQVEGRKEMSSVLYVLSFK